MKKNIISTCFGILLIASLSVPARAQMCTCRDMPGGMMSGMGMMRGMGPGMMMSGGRHLGDAIMQLGLDAKQMEKFRAIREKMMKDMVQKRADLQIAAIDLNDLLEKDTVNMKAVEAALKKKASLETEMELTHIKAHEAMKALLTPDQSRRLKEMRAAGPGMNCPMVGTGAEQQDMPKHGPLR